MSAATAAREENLRTANRIRLARAAHRRQIAERKREQGESDVAALLVAPPAWVASAKVASVLEWPRGRGRAWARAVCRDAGLPDDATVGWLAEHEDALFEVLPRLTTGWRVWTWDRLIALVQYRARVLGRTPSRTEVERVMRCKHSTRGPISVLFGSYGALLDVAELEATPGPGVGVDAVPVATLRAAFDASGLKPSQVAERMGWFGRSGGRMRPDGGRVRRALGMSPDSNGRGGPRTMRRHVGYDLALRLLRAMDLDPVDVGL